LLKARLDQFELNLTNRARPDLIEVCGLCLMFFEFADSEYVRRVQKREKNSASWAEYTLNEAYLTCEGLSVHEIRQICGRLSSRISTSVCLKRVRSTFLLLSSTDSWATAKFRFWACRSVSDEKEFQFFEDWKGEDELLLVKHNC